MNENIALFIFDFDGTLVKGHSHYYVGKQIWERIKLQIERAFFKTTEERAEKITKLEQQFSTYLPIDLMKSFLADEDLGWKNEEQLVRLFKNIISSGHKIAIASFNDYSDAVKYALEQLLGKEIVKNIYIKTGLPAKHDEEIKLCNKVPYIAEIMRNIGITNKKNVFFMDDDKKHTDAATDYKIQAVLVKTKGTEYIHEAFKFLYEFNEQHEIYVELNYLDTAPLLSEKDLKQEIIESIGFEPISDDYYSDGEYTPWGDGNVPTLGNG
jgi:FMN phosphatase YigB (HAD superfamily)